MLTYLSTIGTIVTKRRYLRPPSLMPKTHILKTVQPFYDGVVAGRKKFEVRKNDKNFEIHDIVILSEYDVATNYFSRETTEFEITGILLYHRKALQDGYVVLRLDNFDYEIVTGDFKVGDEVVDMGGKDRVVSYVLSHNDFPQGLKEGYSIICFE